MAVEHVHPYQEERVEVLSGSVRFRVRGQERDVGAGETIVVPAGTPHVWGNPGEEEVHVLGELRPALKTETLIETYVGLAKDGKVNAKNGFPNPLQLAVIAREYEDEIYLGWPPLIVQRVLFGLLASIGTLLGYKARYPEYSGAEQHLAGREVERPSTASGATRGRSGGCDCRRGPYALVGSTARPLGQKIAPVPPSENFPSRHFGEQELPSIGYGRRVGRPSQR